MGVTRKSKMARNLSTGTVGNGHMKTKMQGPRNKTTTVMRAGRAERASRKPHEERLHTVTRMKTQEMISKKKVPMDMNPLLAATMNSIL